MKMNRILAFFLIMMDLVTKIEEKVEEDGFLEFKEIHFQI